MGLDWNLFILALVGIRCGCAGGKAGWGKEGLGGLDYSLFHFRSYEEMNININHVVYNVLLNESVLEEEG